MSLNNAERLFKQAALEAGLDVQPPRPIRSDTPVVDRNGKTKKTVTVPDFFVTNVDTGKSAHVEVTKGSGKNPHKEAQLRVAQQAGVKNYIQLTGDQVSEANSLGTIEAKRFFLLQLLGLIL